MNTKEQYEKLTNIVNQNLLADNKEMITFETYENINFNIYEFPLERLLAISDNKQFLYEACYKILDRIIDINSYNNFIEALNSGSATKASIINNLCNSKECKRKKTKIINKRA